MSTIGKALTLLDMIAGLSHEAGLSELSRLSGLDKATTRRFLVQLERFGFLEQDEQTRKYRIGAAPLRLAQIREARLPLLQHGVPMLRRLAASCGETVHMSEFTAGRLSTIHAEESFRAHRVTVKVGTLLPLHASGSGLAYLAFSPPLLIEDYLSRPLERFTPHTIVETQSLRALLEETRRLGYSVNRQGLEGGMISVAAPILAPNKPPVGAVAIAAPLVRVDDRSIETLGQAVMETASDLSAALYPVSDREAPAEPPRRLPAPALSPLPEEAAAF